MDHVAIRAELVRHLTAACAPVRVVDEEADVVAGLTVVVCWVGCKSDQTGWLHEFEERIILSGHSDARPHFAERDTVVRQVATAMYGWGDTARSWKSSRPAFEPRTVTVGGASTPAVVCRHNVFQPAEI